MEQKMCDHHEERTRLLESLTRVHTALESLLDAGMFL